MCRRDEQFIGGFQFICKYLFLLFFFLDTTIDEYILFFYYFFFKFFFGWLREDDYNLCRCQFT